MTFVSALSSLDKLAKIKAFHPLVEVVKVSPVVDGFVQVRRRTGDGRTGEGEEGERYRGESRRGHMGRKHD